MTKTWGELDEGDTVLDKNGTDWTVYSAPERATATTVSVGITNGKRYVSVDRPTAEDAPMLAADVPDTLAEAGITGEVIAVETAEQTRVRTGDGPRLYPSGQKLGRLPIRSHLYLVHEHTAVANLSDFDEMLALHDELHGKGLTIEHQHSDETDD